MSRNRLTLQATLAQDAGRPRIDQMLPSYFPGDAIGNEVARLRQIFEDLGFASHTFAEQHHSTLAHLCSHYHQYAHVQTPERILVYHYSIGSVIPYYLLALRPKLITVYHNITPSEFFSPTANAAAFHDTRWGRQQMGILRTLTGVAWAHSRYNAQELVDHGFSEPTVLPVLRDYERLLELPTTPDLVPLLNSRRPNLIFVGRMAPNKGHHDLVAALDLVKHFLEPRARLICVGHHEGYPGYRDKVLQLAATLGLTVADGLRARAAASADVWLTGPVTDNDLATIYRHSDVFLCMSDHEGFCVPLIESMFFGLPIVAHDTAAVPETLGSGGIVIDKRDPAALLHAVKAALAPAGRENLRAAARQRAQMTCQLDVLQMRFREAIAAAVARFRASAALSPETASFATNVREGQCVIDGLL